MNNFGILNIPLYSFETSRNTSGVSARVIVTVVVWTNNNVTSSEYSEAAHENANKDTGQIFLSR
jgi:hypothetical protein